MHFRPAEDTPFSSCNISSSIDSDQSEIWRFINRYIDWLIDWQWPLELSVVSEPQFLRVPSPLLTMAGKRVDLPSTSGTKRREIKRMMYAPRKHSERQRDKPISTSDSTGEKSQLMTGRCSRFNFEWNQRAVGDDSELFRSVSVFSDMGRLACRNNSQISLERPMVLAGQSNKIFTVR